MKREIEYPAGKWMRKDENNCIYLETKIISEDPFGHDSYACYCTYSGKFVRLYNYPRTCDKCTKKER